MNLLSNTVRAAALFLMVNLIAMAQQPAGDAPKADVPRAGRDGVGMPKCKYCPDPEYSEEAKKKNYEGVVVLFVVITPEGRAANIRVTKSPGLGLDEKAIEAVRKWKFKPATKDGKPIATQVPIEVTFRLH